MIPTDSITQQNHSNYTLFKLLLDPSFPTFTVKWSSNYSTGVQHLGGARTIRDAHDSIHLQLATQPKQPAR
jgi:hypothetical protein